MVIYKTNNLMKIWEKIFEIRRSIKIKKSGRKTFSM